ncbi:Acyl-CoA/acyl-ACP dehydrogenase [Frankia sp. AiPs1]|uniref:acyl-CoA dehydrogenase family protein n=1 Tax=Frankia sp. AiPa1 TaxID=573492 RepID=UPI00202ADC6E|nr:acyl-CoA dehydrogenase family protein [Frankia sp. AiPa1]MCL9759999.1 acyl-CoA dehydrogenase family protein [Frankia sp. AiPa1]
MSTRLLAAPTAEQQLLLDTSERFIEDTLPVSKVREIAEGAPGPDGAYFETAGSLGWFGLLVDEAHGGGSASDNGLLDAAAVAAERGARLQPGPFVGTNVVASALSRAGAPFGKLLARLIAGQARATWVAGAARGLTPGAGEITARAETGGYVLDGEVRHVQEVADCEALLVTARGPAGLLQAVVATDAPGIEVRPLDGIDITRRTGAVRLDGARVGADAVVGAPGSDTEALFDRQAQIAAVLVCAEAVGTLHRDFELALEHAKVRIAFGRPIGSFQAIKHLLADTSLTLEMAKGLVAAAAEALGADAANGGELAHAAKAFVGERGIDVTHACFQVFGGIGYTWEHDHHLYMRRLAADAVAFGAPQWHRARLADRIGVA